MTRTVKVGRMGRPSIDVELNENLSYTYAEVVDLAGFSVDGKVRSEEGTITDMDKEVPLMVKNVMLQAPKIDGGQI